MIKSILAGAAVVVAVFLILAAMRPDTFRVERSTTIAAPPEKVHALIDDFGRWQSWSPYEKKDPAMKRIRSGPPSGQGAVYAWEGNKEIGKGRMEIIEATPTSIRIKLDFIEPFEAHNVAEFVLVPKGEATKVTWSMQGANNFVAKMVHTVIDVDRMVGKDFEAGLATLKAISERQAGLAPQTAVAAGDPQGDGVQHRGAQLGVGASAARPRVE
jgi:carbon monoxide dehydrogenase subunit G